MTLKTQQRLAQLGADKGDKDTPETSSDNPTPEVASGGTPAPQLNTADITAAVTAAMATSHARMTTVQASAEYVGRESQANAFLSDAKMATHSAEDIIALLAQAPKPTASATDADAGADAGADVNTNADTPVFDATGKAVMGADGKQMVIKAKADADIPVFDAAGKPVMDKEGKQMTIKSKTPDNLVYDAAGKPVMDADGKQMTIPTQSHAGATVHAFNEIMNKDVPVGSDGGESPNGFSSEALNGLDDEQTANVITLLSSAKMAGGKDNLNKNPDIIPNAFQSTPVPNSDAEMPDVNGRSLEFRL